MFALRLALAAMFLAGCASLPSTPFSQAQSCQAVGGIYRADGRCDAGLP
jgi:hypothetical protein